MRRLTRPCPRALRFIPLLAFFGALVGALGGCGGGYTIEGRVLRGSIGMVTIVDADDKRLEGTPLAGASIKAIRDPGRLSSKQLGSTVAGSDGTFKLRIDSFGAGMLQEEWLIVASRAGTAGAEGVVSLPASPGRRRVLVILASGTPAGTPGGTNDRWGSSSDDLMRDFERYR